MAPANSANGPQAQPGTTTTAPSATAQPQTQLPAHQLNAAQKRSPDRERDRDRAADATADQRPPAKRSRKAVNCEPCRASKLKCDKARPCSSCVLRGTVSSCYMDAKDDPHDHRRNGIDPHNEIARIRQSLATLEAYVIRGSHISARSAANAASAALEPVLKQEMDADTLPENAAPGMLAEKGKGGFYAGPTSTATLLFSLRAANDAKDGEDGADRNGSHSDDRTDDSAVDLQRGLDDDLLQMLPAIHIIDGLVDYYFEYCNWMYRHVNQAAFTAAWSRFKEGAFSDRLVLATLSVIMAVAIRYLPDKHALLSSLPQTREELAEQYYEVAREAHSRYRAESRSLSLELVELLLIRTHYLTLSKNESEEIWSIRGDLVSIGTAMGLHRDPEKWRMPRELAERRRWAWWHIVLLERWQCFLFGRPLSVASHHFDTRLPSFVDPAIDRTGRLYIPNILLFKLAAILGDVVDDAVSIRPVPYERVLERDRQLVQWSESLPKELDLDEYRVARALASPIPADMRLGVQSVLLRTSYYHIRFTLHRPYAAAAHDQVETNSSPNNKTDSGSASTGGVGLHERMAQSLDTAASAADKLIQLVGQARPDLIVNSPLAVPAHVHWGPFHCFSAAMFFSFQLIANPEQPGANLFRANIRRVIDILAMSSGVPIADKATDILTALAPLYDPSLVGKSSPQESERMKQKVLSLVKTLAIPYHDSLGSARSQNDSPGTRSLDSPLRAGSLVPHGHGGRGGQHSLTGAGASPIGHRSPPERTSSGHLQSSTSYARAPQGVHPSRHHSLDSNILSHQHSQQQHSSSHMGGSMDSSSYFSPHSTQYGGGGMTQTPGIPMYTSADAMMSPQGSMGFGGGPGSEEVGTWGASVGIGQSEWARFLNAVHGPTGVMSS